MRPKLIEGMTRHMGAPDGWDPSKPLIGVPIRDVPDDTLGNVMVSSWELEPNELEMLLQGGGLLLGLSGTRFPVMWVKADAPEGDPVQMIYTAKGIAGIHTNPDGSKFLGVAIDVDPVNATVGYPVFSEGDEVSITIRKTGL